MAEINELLSEFLAEALDILEKVRTATDQLGQNPGSTEALDAIFRGVHTIKGSSGMFSFENTKKIAHQLESNLADWKKRAQPVSSAEISSIQTELDKIEKLLKSNDQARVEESVSAPVDAAPVEASSSDSAKPEKSEPPVAPSPSVSSQEAPAPANRTDSAPAVVADDYIRVSVGRINDTMNGISEVFLIRNQMVYLVERLRADEKDLKDFYQNWELLDGSMRRAIGELERSAMSMRMMTVQGLFSRMARVVQSYRASSKKQIEFKTEGEETEFDKKVLDTLGEPLIHLVRNAMDHGIETPEEREHQGKLPAGVITLRAEIAGNDAVIQIRDDGKGMDPQKILASAKKKGIDVSHVNDDKSAIELIFLPGFSTAEKVSDISGRGVGMDAVKTSISALGGTVTVDTKLGQGSIFTVRIPVTMSLVPVVLVNIKGFKYAVPNSDILEVRNLNIDQVRSNAGKDYVLFRGSYIPCIDLRKKVQCAARGFEEKLRERSVIIFKLRTEVLAAQISSFERNTEIIIKPLSRVSPKVSGVTGVSVLPTGEPIFVLSLSKLFEAFRNGEVTHAAG